MRASHSNPLLGLCRTVLEFICTATTQTLIRMPWSFAQARAHAPQPHEPCERDHAFDLCAFIYGSKAART